MTWERTGGVDHLGQVPSAAVCSLSSARSRALPARPPPALPGRRRAARPGRCPARPPPCLAVGALPECWEVVVGLGSPEHLPKTEGIERSGDVRGRSPARPPPCLAAGALPGMLGGGRWCWTHRNRPGSAGDGGDREEWGGERGARGIGGDGARVWDWSLGFHRALSTHEEKGDPAEVIFAAEIWTPRAIGPTCHGGIQPATK